MLQRIDKALITSPGLSFAVSQGLGGQGKSQIALENCQKKESIPYSAIFWVDASTNETVQGSFQAISEELKDPGEALPNIQARVALVLRKLTPWSARWLMVLDNYGNPMRSPVLKSFPEVILGQYWLLVGHADIRMLVYDKNTDFITLPGLEKDAAVLLLTQKSQTKDYNSEDAMRIVERLGYHPLAITQAGAHIWQRELQLCHFTEHHKKRKEVILKNTPRFSQTGKLRATPKKKNYSLV